MNGFRGTAWPAKLSTARPLTERGLSQPETKQQRSVGDAVLKVRNPKMEWGESDCVPIDSYTTCYSSLGAFTSEPLLCLKSEKL